MGRYEGERECVCGRDACVRERVCDGCEGEGEYEGEAVNRRVLILGSRVHEWAVTVW